MPATAEHQNRLGTEPSLYLRQHADNPVAWYPWGEPALAAARESGRPILLSIGYSACHWCHVMAHESFEDPATSQLMNRNFINIKVDREERPDLDRTYQLAHQMLTGRPGGWPLTLFLDPIDLAPFFAGTYFPARPRYGMPAFSEVLERVAAWYRDEHEGGAELASRIRDTLAGVAAAEPGELAAQSWRDGAIAEAGRQFDAEYGGFGAAQKFPRAPLLELLEDAGGDTRAAQILDRTLSAMARGGIHDHVGGGFYRYAVDRAWEIPHFEKMLYDNALLLDLYAFAWRRTGEAEYARAARGIVRWLMSGMRAPEGLFYSSLDADSEGGEGAFYTWTPEALRDVLDQAPRRLIEARFGLDSDPNFEGRWHLHVARNLDDAAQLAGVEASAAPRMFAEAISSLAQARSRRAPPARDEKILTAWNAMTIHALARAGRVLSESDWLTVAASALDALREAVWKDGALYAVWAQGEPYNAAYLDDHAWLLRATLSLLQTRWNSDWLDFACVLADRLLDRFADPEDGGLWFTANDQPAPLARPRSGMDDAVPAGAAIAVRALFHLGELLGEKRYLDAAHRAAEAFAGQIAAQPSAHAAMVLAASELEEPRAQVILRGEPESIAAWREAIAAAPSAPAVYAIPADAEGLPEALAALPVAAEAMGYVCRAGTCLPPLGELEAVLKNL